MNTPQRRMVEWCLAPLILNLGSLCRPLHSPVTLPKERAPQYVLNRMLGRHLCPSVCSGKKKPTLFTAGN